MASTYVNDLRLEEMATGDQSGTWGTTTNTNLELIAEAFSYGTEGITTNADTHSTVIADGATDPGRSMFLKYTGTLDSTCTITISPNTVSKLWIIENATSGSQSIIIKQGTGGTVTIPSGKTKVIYSDGAGSGGAMIDAFASLNLETSGIIETSSSIQTPLIEFTDGDDAITIADGGATTFAQTATFNDDIIIGDGKTIGSASDVDAMTIAANGQVTFSQTLIGTALDISGDIDVDGTTNLDVVDIDGAVDMASTLAVGGVLTADAGVAIDNITIDGTEIDLSSGNLTVDVAGNIILNADDDGKVFVADDSVTYGLFENSSSDFVIESRVQDKDILFKGNDGGSGVTALTLDMSDAGTAIFNNKVGIGTSSPSNNLHIFTNSGDEGLLIKATGDTSNAIISDANRGNAGATINAFQGKWNGTAVADISFLTGADTTNKDDGVINFSTASAGSTTERMRIASDGNIGIGTTDTGNAKLVFNGAISSGADTAMIDFDGFGTRGEGSSQSINFRMGRTGQATDQPAQIKSFFMGGGATAGQTAIGFKFVTISADTQQDQFLIDAAYSRFKFNTDESPQSNNPQTNNCFVIGPSSSGAVTQSLTDACVLQNRGGELFAVDSSHNNTQLTPHNWGLISSGPSEELAWTYYSQRPNPSNNDQLQTINVDMAKVIRKVEDLVGEKLIYTENSDKDGHTFQNIISDIQTTLADLKTRVETLEG